MKNCRFLFILVSLLTSLCATSVSEQDPDTAQRGYEIARESKNRDSGYNDFVTKLTMVLRNSAGQESKRILDIRTLEESGVGEKSLILFQDPPDVEGTALLSYSNIEGADQQWLFLPTLKRTKRISSSTRSGSFVGSEFSYEDISPQQVEKYSYNYLRTEEVEGLDMYVIERFPKDPKSGYRKQVFWLDMEEYRPFRVENIDRKGTLLKTLTFHDYNKYVGQYWRPDRMLMINHQSGKETELIFSEYSFRSGLSSRDFTRGALERLR